MAETPDGFTPTLERFSGFAAEYDRYLASPPDALAGVLSLLAGVDRPELVVDLGSGTGLSTRYWADRATRVIGIEPNPDMRAEAGRRTQSASVSFEAAFSHATGLPDHCVSIVTCVQALHWMEPGSTFREAQRILKRGGVFAAVDYDWPPVTGSWRADQAWAECIERVDRMEETLPSPRPLRWFKGEHLGRMQSSGCFRHVREFALHHVDDGDAERLVGLLMSQGSVMDLLKAGHSAAELGLADVRAVATAEFGSGVRPWYWTARVRAASV